MGKGRRWHYKRRGKNAPTQRTLNEIGSNEERKCDTSPVLLRDSTRTILLYAVLHFVYSNGVFCLR